VYQALTPAVSRDQHAVETLTHFPVEKRNVFVRNSGRPELCLSWLRDRHGRLQACDPLPIAERPSSTFEWKGNPYRVDGGGDGSRSYMGTDYLVAYWLARYHGFV